jgi:hypothetical protein
MAADAVADHLAGGGHDVGVAYAGTPSDCYLVPPELIADSIVRRRQRGVRQLWEQPIRFASRRRLYADAYADVIVGEDGASWGVADALVGEQGPNYALAKRLQRWRAIEAWERGRTASFNVAPPTWTVSVTKNRLLASIHRVTSAQHPRVGVDGRDDVLIAHPPRSGRTRPGAEAFRA